MMNQSDQTPLRNPTISQFVDRPSEAIRKHACWPLCFIYSVMSRAITSIHFASALISGIHRAFLINSGRQLSTGGLAGHSGKEDDLEFIREMSTTPFFRFFVSFS
ncbi:hypothetical protein CEXT_768811 [Caerostris extrusa]|uniref:Uncharacterized protein n=1 Tax=Caerostris extrusa TaxID=172846 RepID=A0AAV4XK47_CAEEX|nr:hypothetical protein CEXT_768811 [Caerostris extrusa]